MSRTSRQPHIVLIVTAAISTVFFRGQIKWLREAGFKITLICSPGPQVKEAEEQGAAVITIPMERNGAMLRDIQSLWRLWRVLRKIRPDIVNVGTPKAGLLGGIAARLAFTPHLVYTLHGLRFETASGWKRKVLMLAESVSCRNARDVRCVSPSVRERAIQFRVLDYEKAYVVGAGSANGVDCEHYRPTPQKRLRAHNLRAVLGIPFSAPVIGFVGRFTRDKGFAELYRAYSLLRQSWPELHLLLVGDFDDSDPVDPAIREQLPRDPNVHLTGLVSDPAPYYWTMQILALPTYREGLSVVCLEAQAAGVPVITTNATGAVDSVLDGVTGRAVPARDEQALLAALQELLVNVQKREQMGQAAMRWVQDHFRQEVIWNALLQDYCKILEQKPDRRNARQLIKAVLDRVAALSSAGMHPAKPRHQI